MTLKEYIKEQLKKYLGLKSPSNLSRKQIEKIGKWYIEGLEKGIEKGNRR